MPWHQLQDKHIIFKIKVKPNKKETKIINIDNDFIHISLHASPVDGKANEELIYFLSEYFSVSKSSIEITLGEKSKIKSVKLPTNSIIKGFLLEQSNIAQKTCGFNGG